MNLRAVAFAIALLFGASPVVDAICELDCDAPHVNETEPGCHVASASAEGTSMRGVGHACGHRHDGVPVFVTKANGRDVTSVSVAASPVATLHTFVPGPQASHPPMVHGPPGSTARTTAFITVLRI